MINAFRRHLSCFSLYVRFFLGFGIQTILVIKNPESSLLYYGFGYIIYSSLITLSYYLCFLIHSKQKRHRLFLISSFNDLLIKTVSPFVDHRLIRETTKFFKQGISMKMINEGEKYLMAIFCLISYEQQALFHMIYLLQSVFPNLIFSTIQQIASNYFQQTFLRIKPDQTVIKNNELIQDAQLFLRTEKSEQSYFQNNRQPSTPTGI